ncbi:MAG: ABC transporter substrate-binding protein [Stackebrandtia sp.]
MIRQFARRAAAAASVCALAMSPAACAFADAEGAGDNAVKIGWVAPVTGNLSQVGEEMQAAFELYLDINGNRLGGREVELTSVDEGNGPDDVMPDVERMIKEDEVETVGGVLQGDSMMAISSLTQENEIPLVAAGGRPPLTEDQLENVWHTSWVNEDTGKAIAPYVLDKIDGPVYVMGPDYAGGHANVAGFAEAYKDLGGELANDGGEPTWTPYPGTSDFTQYLDEVAASDAEAVFAFYGGADSVDFIKQYAESDVKDLPLFSNFLTEGNDLEAQGEEALGIASAIPYSPDLDNSVNREFIAEWSAVEENTPSIAAVAAWDVGVVLDAAIARIPADEEVTGAKIDEAVAELGEVKSPRGDWQFGPKTHAPIQRYYLREVRLDGDVLSNVVIQDLATLGE